MSTKKEAWLDVYFTLGDGLSSAAVGALTALSVHSVVDPGWDVALAMLAGMAIGTVVHLILGFAVAPILGGIEAMTAGGLTGMYGGMFFAMRDAMQAERVAMDHAVWVGVVFGVLTWAGVAAYNRVLKGPVYEANSVSRRGQR